MHTLLMLQELNTFLNYVQIFIKTNYPVKNIHDNLTSV